MNIMNKLYGSENVVHKFIKQSCDTISRLENLNAEATKKGRAKDEMLLKYELAQLLVVLDGVVETFGRAEIEKLKKSWIEDLERKSQY